MASFIAAATSYATRGVPMIPFYTFYSMFGFQRIGDLIWQAADIRARGFLLGATAGRTTLLGEGLQHQDGHSLLLASTVPAVQAYDPAFAYEVGAIVRAGIQRMYGADVPDAERDVIYYLTLYNENYQMPAIDRKTASPRSRKAWCAGCTSSPTHPEGPTQAGDDPVLRHLARGGPRRRHRARRALRRRRRAVVGHVVQEAARGGARRRAVEPAASLAGAACPDRHATARAVAGPDHRRQRLHEDRPRADRPLRSRRSSVHGARHRRHGPLRHPRGAAPVLRDRHGPRRRRCAVGPARIGAGRLGRGRRRASSATTSTPTRSIRTSSEHRSRASSTMALAWVVDEAAHEAFVALSGDRNPIHVDPIAARRLPFGRRAVHGVHLAARRARSPRRRDRPRATARALHVPALGRRR